MASDNQASYAKIGFTIMLGIAGIVGVLIYFGGVGTGGRVIPAETYFHNPVSGLAVGSDVCFRGVKVGSVKRISFIANEYEQHDPAHGQAIWVGLSIDPRLCGFDETVRHPEENVREIISKGLHATVAANILTGIAHIELNFPKTEIKEAPISWRPRDLCVPPAPTLLESASDALPVLLAKLERIDFAGSWSNVLSTVENANALMGSVNTLVDSQQGNVTEILGNMRDASASLRDFADKIRDNPSLLLRSRDVESLPETMR